MPRAKRAPRSAQGPRIAALAVLALAAGLLWIVERAPKPSAMAQAPVPDRVGLWQGKALEVQDRAVEILETDDVTLMEYRLGKEPPVWLAQVAGFGNRAAFHPPELCYIGSHFEILAREPIAVHANGRTYRLMRLVIAQEGQRFESWYWFTANGRITPNYYQQQLWLVMDAIRREPASGTLVRISTAQDRPDAAHRRLLAFLTSFDSATTPRQLARHDL